MNVIQYEDKFLDLDKVCAFEVRPLRELEELKVVDVFELVVIFDSGVGLSLGKSKVKTNLTDFVAGKWKVSKKGMFSNN
jgi:hypothetical protein